MPLRTMIALGLEYPDERDPLPIARRAERGSTTAQLRSSSPSCRVRTPRQAEMRLRWPIQELAPALQALLNRRGFQQLKDPLSRMRPWTRINARRRSSETQGRGYRPPRTVVARPLRTAPSWFRARPAGSGSPIARSTVRTSRWRQVRGAAADDRPGRIQSPNPVADAYRPARRRVGLPASAKILCFSPINPQQLSGLVASAATR
jgi:hypothetical protein